MIVTTYLEFNTGISPVLFISILENLSISQVDY